MAHARKQRILLATQNPGKARELAALLDADTWECVTPAEAGLAGLVVEESGATYHENAARKARAFANASGLPALADDSGLEVDALDGAPGVRSARYAGVDSTGSAPGDAANRAKLLAALQGVPPVHRGARFRAVVALALPYGPDARYGEGSVEGAIAEDERGSDGFGYDPIFALPDGRRMAELSAEEKNRVSHRARALRDAARVLESIAEALREPHAKQRRSDGATH